MTHDPHAPVACYLTIRTYGTRLPGSAAGWTTRTGHGLRGPDPRIEAHARSIMRWPPLRLDERQRAVIEKDLRELCEERGWTLHDAVMTEDHLHALVTAALAPVPLRTAVKARLTATVKRAGLLPRERALWADYGSARLVIGETAIADVCEYIDAHRPPL